MTDFSAGHRATSEGPEHQTHISRSGSWGFNLTPRSRRQPRATGDAGWQTRARRRLEPQQDCGAPGVLLLLAFGF